MDKVKAPSKVISNLATTSDSLLEGATVTQTKVDGVLISKVQTLSVRAKRVFLMLIGQVAPQTPFKDVRYTIEAADYAAMADVSLKGAYRDMKLGGAELMGLYITVQEGKDKTEELVSILTNVKYHADQGWLDAKFNEDMIPHVTALTGGFTTLRLEEIMKFRKFYTMRLYELLMRFEKTGERYISIEDFRELFQIKEGRYTAFTDIRRRIVNPAILEMEAKTNWRVEWDVVKKGRNIKSLLFVFELETQKSLDLD